MPQFEITQTDVVNNGDDGTVFDAPEGTVAVTVGDRTFVYVTNAFESSGESFELNADGTLTHIAQFDLDTFHRAATSVNIGGAEYLLLAGFDMTLYAIGADGTLTQTDTQTAPTAANLISEGVAATTIGGTTFALIANRAFANEEIYVQIINPDGTFGSVTATIERSANATLFDDDPLSVELIDVDGTAIGLVSLDNGRILSFVVNADGTTGPMTAYDSQGGSFPRGFDTFSVGDTPFVVIAQDEMVVYRVNADGTLTQSDLKPNSDFSFGGEDANISSFEVFETPDGRAFAYVANSIGDTALVEFNDLGNMTVVELIDGVDISITDQWRGGAAVQVGGSAFFINASESADGVVVHKMTLGADVAIYNDQIDVVEFGSGNSIDVLLAGVAYQMVVPATNAGDLAFGTTPDVQVYLSNDDTLDTTTDVLLISSFNFDLPPGADDIFNLGFSVPNGTLAGTQYLFIATDTGDEVVESDETNNVSIGFEVEITFFTDQDDDVTLFEVEAPQVHDMMAGKDTVVIEDSSAQVSGGDGNDVFTVNTGARSVVLFGGNNNDTFNLNGENGIFNGDGGKDKFFGGDSMQEIYGGNGGDVVKAGLGDDIIYGDGGSDLIFGAGDNDFIFGGNGQDNIKGGNGDDDIVGGGKADTLSGGSGQDLFIFSAEGHTGVGAGNRDIISDFKTGTDQIVLTDLDGDTGRRGDQNLTFLGTDHFSGSGGQGEVRIASVVDGLIVEIDRNADGATDMEILLAGATAIDVSDFAL